MLFEPVGLGLAELEEDEPDGVGEGAATLGVPLVGPAVATAPCPPVWKPLSGICGARKVSTCSRDNRPKALTAASLEPMAFAAATKAALLLPLEGALIVLQHRQRLGSACGKKTYPTMPAPQCAGALQKK